MVWREGVAVRPIKDASKYSRTHGGDADLTDQIDIGAGEQLGVVEFGEFAAVVEGNELLKFLYGLAAEGAAIDQKEDAARAGKFDETINKIASGKSLATTGSHLDESTWMVGGEGLFKPDEGLFLSPSEAALIERRHDAQFAADGEPAI